MIGPTIVGPPLDLGLSLCHPVEDPPPLWRPLAVTLGSVVLGFAGLLGGAALAALSDDGGRAGTTAETLMLTVGVACSRAGHSSRSSAGSFSNRGWVKRQLGDRFIDAKQRDWAAKPAVIQIEDAATFSKLKLNPGRYGRALCRRPAAGRPHRGPAVPLHGLLRRPDRHRGRPGRQPTRHEAQLPRRRRDARTSSSRGRTASVTSCASRPWARRRPRCPTSSAKPSASWIPDPRSSRAYFTTDVRSRWGSK